MSERPWLYAAPYDGRTYARPYHCFALLSSEPTCCAGCVVAAAMATTLAVLPVIDMAAFLAGDASDPAVQDSCRAVAACLRDTGALIVRDPRVNAHDNSKFLDMMEAYFSQSHEAKLADVHSELCYQARAAVCPFAVVCVCRAAIHVKPVATVRQS